MELLQGADLTKLVTLIFVGGPSPAVSRWHRIVVLCGSSIKVIISSPKYDALAISVSNESKPPSSVGCVRRTVQGFNHHGEDVTSNNIDCVD